MSDVRDTLNQRGAVYGLFRTHAVYADNINAVYVSSPKWNGMNADNKEALRIIANKIGRILNGDPEYLDNWVDIAGYAQLVADRIEDETKVNE